MIRFLEPWWLLALLPVLALAAAYACRHLLRRFRRDTALPFSNLELLRSLVPRGLGWRRHVAAATFLAALFALVAALARPSLEVEEPLERATIILAIDVSLSMQAGDVEPTRMEAAQAAAKDFVTELPGSYNLGLVSFAKSANVLVSPGKDREAVTEAIDALQMAEATATGEAVLTSLDAIKAVPGAGAEGPPPARIVLLSDGYRTYGRSIEEAAAAAVEANVPVTTIAFGTDTGMVDIAGQMQRVPVDREALAQLAETTGGFFYEAASAAELAQVYQDMGSSIGHRTVPKEIGQWFAGVALLFGLAAGSLSLLWASRLP
ncbi:membrane protein [Catellatospora sp. IY07-71]|uniref:VWA domain-containing protein n=1 Tax=Catellatospora sp. IY07-71 TaxID=2728827 RepID=UPI001BB3685B|nr:VWA domain-containing protein [Catellatospora sp. IY07-71]BCJ77605.1 membrane protein [Catellatospora sp. IY07-71]